MRIIRENTRLIFLIVLPVYLFIVQASITNRHTHFFPNGMVVTHTHPFEHGENGNADGHNHSKTEICFYAGLSFDFYLAEPSAQLLHSEGLVSENTTEACENFKQHQSVYQIGLRGPPALQIN